MTSYLIKNGTVVRTDNSAPEEGEAADILIVDGKIAAIGANLESADAEIVDASGKLIFPGVVDAHQHWGIYNPLAEDTQTESRASAQGGVTTALTYMRTGQYYLNKGGAYADFFPEVLDASAG